ncbi:hypothetical protein CVT24_003360 [Panaeolus cyanescens]|uniref:Carboxylic ester hydrolase n=1 Tax=Panaeolus cyanescens TaxID=181874 RepID=A0A409Y6Z8_9AGAR|nr:hypothetical protein CVT24_003360 [Panaeolus cyanescens]
MVRLSLFALTAAVLVSPSFASPAINLKSIFSQPLDPKKIICQLPLTLKQYYCPPTGVSALNRPTQIGTAIGVNDNGAYRFSVKYASASRWQPSTIVSTWQLPNGFTDPSQLPLICPQPDVDDPSTMSEDCLSIVLYVPPALTLTSAASTLVWIHGGSSVVGSATALGLDGAKLAVSTNSLVAVVQYRLGALGFLAHNGQKNLAVKDVINAITFLKSHVASFGGSSSKITLAGQSSGAGLIRALLATPSASSLFRSAILHSDPMNYGFLDVSTHNALLANFLGQIACASNDNACFNTVSLDTIIAAQMQTMSNVKAFAPAAGPFSPIRPVLDGSLITNPLDSPSTFPSVTKPLMITSVGQEAGSAIFSIPIPVDQSLFSYLCLDAFIDPVRTNIIMSNPLYALTPGPNGEIDGRVQLQVMGTDQQFKCASWTFTRNYVQRGGSVYVGQFVVGATYPPNNYISYCTQPGIVCHQDDIQIVFGTVPNPTAAQAALISEMQKRYKAFLTNGNPNAAGLPTWSASTATNVRSLLLGGTGEAPVGACTPSFWGSAALYDYQFFNQ